MQQKIGMSAALLSLAVFFGLAATASAQPNRQRIDFRGIFQQLDANRDGVVVRDEVPEKGLEAFDKILKHCDENDDGKLQGEEVRSLTRKMVRALGDGVPQADPDEIAKMDKDEDGKITRREYTGPPQLFGMIDTDRNGSISQEELEEFGEDKPFKNMPEPERDRPNPNMPAFGNGNGQGLGEAMIAQRFKRMDGDNDGKISRDEFDGRPQMFDRLDADKDGSISAEELKNIATSMRPMPGQPGQAPGVGAMNMNNDRMRAMDTNNDRKISRDEFRGPAPLFDRLDVNKDGFISPEDRDAMTKKARQPGNRLRDMRKKAQAKNKKADAESPNKTDKPESE